MNMCIWRLAGVSLLALSISAQVVADDNNPPPRNDPQQPAPQKRGFEVHGQPPNQQRGFGQDQQRQQQQQNLQQQQQQNQQQRQQEQLNQQRQIQQNQQQRFDQQRQQQERERNQQRQNELQQQQRQDQLQQQQIQQQQRQQQRQLQDRQGNLPIQGRPDTVVQTQSPRQGFYKDIPRDNNRFADHGDGWGAGPRFRPGYEIDRMPGGYSRVPYRGNDYYYSSGYWYRPQGPRYVVVEPPRGVRVRTLPDYAQQVWLGSSLFFVAAGTYYSYEQSTQEYVVAEPPQNVQPVYSPVQGAQPAADPYDVIAYPANGQSQEQVEQDRYDCYRYAVQQSNFDPAAATYQPAPEVIGLYRQAMAGCYAGRGYNVQQ